MCNIIKIYRLSNYVDYTFNIFFLEDQDGTPSQISSLPYLILFSLSTLLILETCRLLFFYAVSAICYGIF